MGGVDGGAGRTVFGRGVPPRVLPLGFPRSPTNCSLTWVKGLSGYFDFSSSTIFWASSRFFWLIKIRAWLTKARGVRWCLG